MSKSIVTKMMVMAIAAALIVGCATGGKGPSDQELIQLRVQAFKDALLAKDIDKLMASVSEKFYHPEVGDKNAAKDLLKQGLDSGYTQDGQVDLTKMQIKIEKDKKGELVATAYPIVASAAPGSVTVGLTLRKEPAMAAAADAKDKKAAKKKMDWYITEINVEGV